MYCMCQSDPERIQPIPASEEELNQAAALLRGADAVLLGVGTALSSLSGYDLHMKTEAFAEHFGDYEEAYAFDSFFKGLHYVYSYLEEQWAFYARYINFMLQSPPGSAYLLLKELLGEKPYFILNGCNDAQISKVFPEERVFSFDGDLRFMQCRQPCCDRLFDSAAEAQKLDDAADNFRIPSELLPRCPECGRILQPWMRNENFLEGEAYRAQAEAFRHFAETYRDKKLLLFELGIGEMIPGFIKMTFWQLAKEGAETFYLTVSTGKDKSPEQLRDKSLTIGEETETFLKRMKERL